MDEEDHARSAMTQELQDFNVRKIPERRVPASVAFQDRSSNGAAKASPETTVEVKMRPLQEFIKKVASKYLRYSRRL